MIGHGAAALIPAIFRQSQDGSNGCFRPLAVVNQIGLFVNGHESNTVLPAGFRLARKNHTRRGYPP